jgi:hypothetical protein
MIKQQHHKFTAKSAIRGERVSRNITNYPILTRQHIEQVTDTALKKITAQYNLFKTKLYKLDYTGHFNSIFRLPYIHDITYLVVVRGTNVSLPLAQIHQY